MKNFLNLNLKCSVWLLLLLFGVTSAAQAQGTRASDSLELVAFYNATGGANWRTKTNWLTNNPINTWYGVGLNGDGRVTYLTLSSNQLSGSIPNFTLPNLQQLSLNGNQLSGSIPNFNLPNLQYLWLQNNQLSGSIPNFNLPNLKYIQAEGNQFSGSIPNFNLSNLEYLSLSLNQLSGSIPNFNLPNLQTLYLAGNQLSSSIPNFNLPNLTSLYLNNNQLSGSIPNFNLPNLTSLYLNNNQLSGSIPNFNLPNLKYLLLSSNQLSGSIPNFNLPNLQQLHLHNNQLSGCIPSGIKTNCPRIGSSTGNISNNPNLSTQSWASYWNNIAYTHPYYTIRQGDSVVISGRAYRASGQYTVISSGVCDSIITVKVIPSNQIRHFVKHDATGLNNGSSWANAFTDLQTAINVANINDEIWVAAGTYKPTQYFGTGSITFYINKKISLYGGFNGSESLLNQRNLASYRTILSGDVGVIGDMADNIGSIVTLDTANSILIDGFTIEQGKNDNFSTGGGGINNKATNTTITNCIFRNNYAEWGAAINNDLGTIPNDRKAYITNCVFTSNSTAFSGGRGTIRNQNYSNGLLDTIYVINCTVTNDQCFIRSDVNATTNSKIHTIIKNSIFWNASWSWNFFNTTNATANISYSLMSSLPSNAVDGGGNLIGNFYPQFRNPSQDFSLLSTSPAVNVGTPLGAPATDIVGTPRSGNPDMGAYEGCYSISNQYYTLRQGDSVVVNGRIYRASGTYQDRISRTGLCDSIVVININEAIFTNSGIFPVPTHVNKLTIEVIGGGGAGGGNGGAGGGGGGYAKGVYPVTPTTNLTITIGAGGNWNPYNSGGTTSVDTLISATGGSNGGSNAAGNGGVGRNGNVVNRTGGAGGMGTYTNFGGGGGGAAGTTGNGSNGGNTLPWDLCLHSGGASGVNGGMPAGNGGAGSGYTRCNSGFSTFAGHGQQYGGGGGGGNGNGSFAGIGASGYCKITWAWDSCQVTTPQYRTIRQGDSVVVNSHVYRTSGTYQDTIIRSGLCDSVIVTNLTVVTCNLSASIIRNGNTLTATATGGRGTYRFLWSNQATTQAINNANAGVNYQVTVTDSLSCTATATFTISAQPLYQLQVTDAQCGSTEPATLRINMNTTRDCIDALTAKIQFDSTKVFFDNNLTIQKGAAIDSSGIVRYYLYKDTLFVIVDLERGCIQGDSGINVLRIPFRLRPTFALPGATSLFHLAVLEERVASSPIRANIVQSFEVATTLVGKVQVVRPNGVAVTGTTRPLTLAIGDSCNRLNRAIPMDSNANAMVRLDSFRFFKLHRPPLAAAASPLLGAFDIFLLARYAVSSSDSTIRAQYTPRQKIAADVNNDGNISALDITILRRRAVGIYTNFTDYSGGRLTCDYQFTPQNVDSPQVCFRLPNISTTCDTPNVRLNMITLGDLNGDTDNSTNAIVNNNDNTSAKNNTTITLNLCRAVRVANEWKIPIYANTVTRALDLQLLNVPISPDLFRIESANPTNFDVLANGNGLGQNYYIVGYATVFQGIQPTDTLLYLYVKTANLTPQYLGNVKSYQDAILVNSYLMSQQNACSPISSNDELYQNPFEVYPNPTTGSVQMTTQQPLSENTTLRIYDMLGRNVKNIVLQQGNSNFTIDMSDVANGVYQFHFANQYKKVVKQ